MADERQNTSYAETTDNMRAITSASLVEYLEILSQALLNSVEQLRDPALRENDPSVRSFLPPSEKEIEHLLSKGIDIDPEGVVYKFGNNADIQLTEMEALTYFSLSLSKFKELLSLPYSKVYKQGQTISLGGREELKLSILHTNTIIKFLLVLWQRYAFFSEKNQPMSQEAALTNILDQLMDGFRTIGKEMNIDGRWVNQYLTQIRTGVLCEFSAYLIYKRKKTFVRVVESFDENELIELESNSVDIVALEADGTTTYIQVKNFGYYDADEDYKEFIGDEQAVINYIVSHYPDAAKQDRLIQQLKKIVKYAREHGGKWRWIFVKPLAYRSFKD